MKKTIFLISSLLFATAMSAQVENTENTERNLQLIIKPKIGFGELDIKDFASVNGFYSAFEFLASSKISGKYNLEYGFGLSEFKASNLSQSNLGSIKNEYVYIPVSLVRSFNLKNDNTMQFGIGVYGNYLYKSRIDSLATEKNVGFNFGYSLQVGAKFKIAEETFFRIMLESQSEFTDVEYSNSTEFKQVNISALSLSFIHKF